MSQVRRRQYSFMPRALATRWHNYRRVPALRPRRDGSCTVRQAASVFTARVTMPLRQWFCWPYLRSGACLPETQWVARVRWRRLADRKRKTVLVSHWLSPRTRLTGAKVVLLLNQRSNEWRTVTAIRLILWYWSFCPVTYLFKFAVRFECVVYTSRDAEGKYLLVSRNDAGAGINIRMCRQIEQT
jgi:hypothetical protein